MLPESFNRVFQRNRSISDELLDVADVRKAAGSRHGVADFMSFDGVDAPSRRIKCATLVMLHNQPQRRRHPWRKLRSLAST